MRPSTLLFSLWALAPAVLAGDVTWLQPCDRAHQKLQEGTFQFQTDCDAMTYCAANSTCALRGCRSDTFPFGYLSNVTIPDKCDKGSFCPDEQDACQKQLTVGSACQFNRDGESFSDREQARRALLNGGGRCGKTSARARRTSRSSRTRPGSA